MYIYTHTCIDTGSYIIYSTRYKYWDNLETDTSETKLDMVLIEHPRVYTCMALEY